MLDHQGFDLWADGYDKTVGLSEEENTYPFAGYKQVLGKIFQTVLEKKNAAVLDIGFGTGTLTRRLYDEGCSIYGQDFSDEMLRIAKEKMSNAHLFLGDFTQGLSTPLKQLSFDFITATYSLHHLTDEQKIPFLCGLMDHLKPGGKLLIGDVAFATRKGLEKAKMEIGPEWDEEECYFVLDEIKAAFPQMQYTPCSFCAGVLMFPKE